MSQEPAQILRWIRQGEGSRTEFKRGLPRASKVARTLAAFANTRGGRFLVGVDDRGQVVGAPRPAATAAELLRIGREDITPPLTPVVERVQLDGLPVVVAVLGLSEARPHRVQREDGESETPIRLGSSTRAASGPTLRAIEEGRRAEGFSGLSELEIRALHWIENQGDAGTDGAGRTTPKAFAVAANVGLARARRVFLKLERAGRLLAHGSGAQRTYSRP